MTTDNTAPAEPTVTTNPSGTVTITPRGCSPRTVGPISPLDRAQLDVVQELIHQLGMYRVHSAEARAHRDARHGADMRRALADKAEAEAAATAVAGLLGITIGIAL